MNFNHGVSQSTVLSIDELLLRYYLNNSSLNIQIHACATFDVVGLYTNIAYLNVPFISSQLTHSLKKYIA